MSSNLTEFLKLWLIVSMSLGCWTCLMLGLNRRTDKKVKAYLLTLIGITLTLPLYAYLNLTWHYSADTLLLLTQKKTWLYGPLLLSLIHCITLKKENPRIFWLGLTPFIFFLLSDYLKPNWISYKFVTLCLFIQIAIYLSLSFNLLAKHKSRLTKLATHFSNSSYFLLMFIAAGLTVFMMIDVVVFIGFWLQLIPSLLYLTCISSLAALYTNVIALLILLKPDLASLAITQSESNKESQTSNTLIDKPIKPQLRTIELSPDVAQQLEIKLSKLIATTKPHLDENISLTKLANHLEISAHQLSELLNVHMQMSFYEYLNRQRFAESLRLIEQENCDFTMADIAYQSGFNNLNSFYKAFKEYTGATPNQYKKQRVQVTASPDNRKIASGQ